MSGLDYDQLKMVGEAFAGTRGNGWVRANCPLCAFDYKMSLGLNRATGGFNCFKCGVTGWLPPDLRDFETAAFPEDAPVKELPPAEELGLPEGFVPIYEEPGWSAAIFDPARAYLRGRRNPISDEVAAAVGVGSTAWGWLSGRVIIPLWVGGKCMGWVGRDFTGTAHLPYLYPANLGRHEVLFNRDALLVETDVPVMVVEGCFDALPYWPDAVACLGKPIGAHQALFLAACRPVVIVLDGDAWEEGWVLHLALKHAGLKRVGFVRLPPKEDPGSVNPAWLWQKVLEAVNVTASGS